MLGVTLTYLNEKERLESINAYVWRYGKEHYFYMYTGDWPSFLYGYKNFLFEKLDRS